MADTSQISNMLGGFSAGLSGNLPQWQQAQNQKQQLGMQEKEAEAKRVQERRKTMFIDADAAKKLLAQGNVDGVIQIGLQRLDYLKQLGVDPSDTQRLTSLAIGAKNGSAEAMKLLNDELDTTIQVGIASGMIEAPNGPETIKASDLYNGQLVQRGADGKPIALDVENLRVETPEKFEIVSGDKAAALGLDPKQQYKINPKTGEPTAVGGGGVTVQNIGKAENAYLNTRAGDQAKAMTDLEKSAESAFRSNKSLERFIASSAKGDKGAAQPFITGAKNLISSFGYSPEGLSDTNKMEQAIGDILGQKMSELGARGLTDRDMDVLRQALPRVNTSHDARVQIADIIKKSNEYVLSDYATKADKEQQQYPDYQFSRPSWFENYRKTATSSTQDDPLGILK